MITVSAIGRNLLVAALVAAVLLVNAACTSAGCLLFSTTYGNAAPESCCGHASNPARPAGDKHCPLCSSVNVNLASDNSHSHMGHQNLGALAPMFSSPLFSSLAMAPQASPFSIDRWDSGTISSGPSLLALHCALLV